jgi:gluconolactonase
MGLAACSGSDSDAAGSAAPTAPEPTTAEAILPEPTAAESTTPETPMPTATTTLAPSDPLVGIGEVTVVAEGLGFLEGPQWVPDSGTLLFTELYTTPDAPLVDQPGIIYELGVGDELSVARASGPTANGLALTEDGAVYATEPGERRVALIDEDGVETVVADQFEGKRFNGPNDVVVAADGSLFFTDPEPLDEPVDAELGFRGAFRARPDGEVELVYPGDNVGFPNGIGLSLDQTRLYVSDSAARRIWAIDLAPDGTSSEPIEFATMEGVPDGMCIDQVGNLFSSSIGVGLEVFAPDGTKWGSIPLPSPGFGQLGSPTNCAFGGDDGLDLYVTTDRILYRVRLAAPA